MPQKMKVCNTNQYNTYLKRRGQIFGLLDTAKELWFTPELNPLGQVGAPFIYSDDLILIIQTVRYLFKMSLRSIAGFFEDMAEKYYQNPHYKVPHYSVLCRRLKQLNIPIKDHREKGKGGPIEICMDSSGINIYNTGGGHSKENGESRQHRKYDQTRKLHIVLDPETGDVENLLMTKGTATDHEAGAQLVEALPDSVEKCCADGAYDKKPLRKVLAKKNIKQIIPPIRNAVIRKPKRTDPPNTFDDRNAAVRLRRSYPSHEEGHTAWKQQENYGTRAHVEGFFSRFKRQFGFHFVSKSEENRAQELRLKTKILNDFNKIGRAKFEKVA